MELTQRIKQRLREVDDWNALIEEFEAQVGQVSEPSAQSRAYFELARACEDLFLDKARAMQCYQKAFKLDQTNLEALRHARLIYQEMAHLEMVTRLMGIELKVNRDPELTPRLNYDYGTAQLNLRQIDTARAFLEAASSAEPGNELFLERFQETLYDRNNWQLGLETVYIQLRALTGAEDPLSVKVANKGEQLSALFLRAARILQQEVPEDPRLLPCIFKALDACPTNHEAGFLAETILATGGHLQHIQKLQDRRVSLVEDVTTKIDLLRRFATVWTVRLENAEMAAYFHHQALDLAYGTGEFGSGDGSWHVAAFRVLVSQADATGQADSLIPLAERGLTVIRDAEQRALVALLAGQLAWRKFDDVDTAQRFFSYAVRMTPDHPVMSEFRSTVGDVEPAEDPPEPDPEDETPTAEAKVAKPVTYAEPPEPPEPEPSAVNERRPSSRSQATRSESDEVQPSTDALPTVDLGDETFTAEEMALIEKARETATKGGKRAIDAWRDAVARMPEKNYPRAQLRQLYVDSSKWSNVAELVKDQIKHTNDDDVQGRAALYWELVELYRDRLRQPGLVVTTLSALEKMLDEAGETAQLLGVIEAQQQQFEQMKRWPDLIGRVRRRAELTEDPEQRKQLHLQAGALFLEKFTNQAEAIKSFEAVLECDQYDPTAIAQLKELYLRRRDWEKMLGIQQRELALIEDPAERKAQLLEVARTAGTKIKKPSLSIELWTQVLDLDPENTEALEHLEQMQEREKDWEALARTLERLVETLGEDASKRSATLVKLGLLYADKLNDNAAAIRTWEALYELEPDNRRAHDALKKLYLSEGDMEALERFYAKQDKWPEFIRVLEREAETAEGEAKTELLLKIGQLYRDKLEKPDRAIRALEKALSDDSENLVIAERLIALYEEASDERHVSTPLQIKLHHTNEREERQALLRRLADLAERVHHDQPAAFDYYQQAFEEDHTVADVREHLERLGEATGRYAELARSLEIAIGKYGSTPESLPLRLTLAGIYEVRLEDPDAALRVNQAILELDPEHAEAIASLERLYLALGREEDLLAVLATKLSLATDDEERRGIQTRIGAILEQLGQHEKAVEAYSAVLEGGSDDIAVLAALDRLYLGLQRWSELASIVERELAVLSEPDEQVDLLLRLAILKQERLEAPADAVALLRQVLDLQPQHEQARARLEGWLDDDALKVEAATILLPVYDAMGSASEQVACLQILADDAKDEHERGELLLRIGSLAAHALGDSQLAFSTYSRAFSDNPRNEAAEQALEAIAVVEDRWGEVAALYEEAVTRDLPTELVRHLLGKLARLYDTRLGEPQKAIDCYSRAVELDPANEGALDALEALHSRDQNWSELLEVYRNKVELASDPETRETLRFKIASLQEDLLGRTDDAIVTYNEILADDDANFRAIAALDRLYQATERWSELAENLTRQLALNDDPHQQAALNLRLGQIRLEKLQQAGLAVETYSAVLDLDPHNEKALAALEGLLEDREQQLAVARILEPIYRAVSDWAKLVGSYEIMVEHALDPSEKVRLLHQIGELYELAGDEPAKAFAAFGRALKEDPSNSDTQARLDNLARQMANYGELVALYESAIADVVDDQLRIRLLNKIAQTYEGAIDDPAKAAQCYERILEIDPSNFQAVDTLIEVHRRTENYEPLVGAVVRKAEMVESPQDQKSLLLYAANIRESVMEEPDGAISLYQQVLTVDDADRRALDALVRLYVQLERWEPLKDIYQRQSELAEDPDERRQALYVLGQVYDVELRDVERAIDTYQAVLELEPDDYEAIQALDRLYGEAERWLDQLQILERAVESADEAQERTGLRYRIGVLWETRVNDMLRAIESYRDVLQHDPHHEPTLEALDRIVHGQSEPMAAAMVLAPLYEDLAAWDKLVDIYEVMVTHTEDPVSKLERLHQVARIYEQRLHEYDKAFAAYASALEADPQSRESLEELERLANITGEWEVFAALLSEQADKLLDPVVKVQMLLRLAKICEEQLRNVDDAIKHHRQVLDSDPENRVAIDALERIFTSLGRWPDLVDNLHRQVTIEADEGRVIALSFRMGQIYQNELAAPAKAIEPYREILSIDPAHQPTLQALEQMFAEGQLQNEIAEILEPIYQAAERWDALVNLGEVKLTGTHDAADRLAIIQSVAEICEHRLDDPEEAYIWWLRAYIDDPLSEQVILEMERLAENNNHWEHIVDVGDQILESNPTSEIRLAVQLRSANVLDEKLNDLPRATEAYRQVLAVEPDHAGALAALDRIYTELGMADELAEVLQRRIRATMDGELLVDLEVRLAHVLETRLSSPEQAVAAYTRALEHDPHNFHALERLEALFLSQHRWEELFDVYQKMVDVSNTDEEMAAAYQRMAKIASDALGREHEAIDLWARVLDLRGEDALALGELSALHERAERWQELVEVLERQVYVVDGTTDRIRIYQTLGRVYGEKLDRERSARDAWLNALELDDTNIETLQALHVIYEDSQAWVELVDILERLLAVAPGVLEPAALRDLNAKVGRIHGEYLMQPDNAIGAWHRVLESDPANMEALAALEELYTQEARWPEAIDVLERKSRVFEGDEKIDVLMQIASIWEEKLEDKVQAAGAYQEILDTRPDHLAAGDALESIHRETEDWASLAELLINRAEIITDVERKVATLQQAAQVLEVELGDQDMAFATLQAAFNVDYANDITARELERLATQNGKWGDLLNEYNGMVQQIPDPMERCELWVKIGRWYGEHLQRTDYGIQSLQKALDLNPDSVSALRELASFYRRGEQWGELADVLGRTVPLEPEPSEQATALLELAWVQEQRLGQLEAAVESYRRVLELDGDSINALDALIRLHQQQGAWEELVTVLGRRAAISEEPEDALRLRKSIGHVQETELRDIAAAVETYKDILAQEPNDMDAMSALERLYMGANRVHDYLEILDAELDATVEPEAQVAIYDKMAHALVELADDRERAAEVLEKIIMLDPGRDATYRRLEDLYRGLERWTELVETYRSHVNALEGEPEKVELLRALGQVFEQEIEDVDRAIETYEEILELDPYNFEAAITLSRLQEQIEDWPSAVATMGRLVELTTDVAQRIELLTRMGRVLHERLMADEEAEMRLNQSLELNPGHIPALVLLADIYKQRADWLKAARTLELASDNSNNLLEKTALAAEAAFINLEELEDRGKAVELLAKTLYYDPEHVRAGRVLVDVYYEEGNFAEADPIFDMLTRKSEQLELSVDEQRDLFLHAATAARALGNAEKALKQYKRAYDIDATDHEVLVGMADLLFEREDWDRSFKLYQTILVQHRDTQPVEDTVRVYHRLGAIKNRQNEPRKALNYFEKALEVEPSHVQTLHEVTSLRAVLGDWEGVIEAKRSLIDVTPDGDGQFTLWSEIGQLYVEKLGNREKGAHAQEAALDIKPDDYPTLHVLLDLYTKSKRWEEAIHIIDRIVEIEKEPKRRSRYNYTAAVLFRDELRAHDEAVERFNMVLDDDPGMLKAFQAIDTLVTQTKDWKTLERSYRKMLKRMPAEGNDALKVTLWSNLAEIYRTRLQDYRAAVAAFDVAAKLEPNNVARHMQMAELYERLIEESPQEFADAAVREHQILIANEPFRYESYHALFNIYVASNQADKAYCVASTLSFLKKATREEEQFVEQHKRGDYVMARQRLSEDTLRRHVFHPDQDLYLTAILGLISTALAKWRGKELPPGFSVQERVDISIDPSLFSRMAKYTKDVLNVPQPDVYLRPQEAGDIEIQNIKRDNAIYQSMFVFQNLLRGLKENQLAFSLARNMMDLYLPHYAYVVLDRSPDALKQVFMACLRIVGMPVQTDAAALDLIAREITSRMEPAALDQLRSLIQKFVAAGGSTDVKRWAAAVELTAYRVGLLLSQDLWVAGQMISHEKPKLGSRMSARDKIKELVLYSISEDYFAARRAIGVHID